MAATGSADPKLADPKPVKLGPVVEVLGIRHHGPGSARSVLAALDELQPDLVLIEGAPELDALVPTAHDSELVPPVAALVYDPKTPRRSLFYPLASFSPEWVALRWARQRGVAVRFADLPAVHQLAEVAEPTSPEAPGSDETELDGAEPSDANDSQPNDTDPKNSASDDGETNDTDPDDSASEDSEPGSDEAADPPRPDLIAMLAEVAGYDDAEQWWEDAVEHRHDSALADFGSLLELIGLARDGLGDTPDPDNERREAAMRKVLRAAMKEHDRIAVVCGAYHAPALAPANFPTQAADNRLLAKLPKTKVSVTWAPWTASRLAQASGYGAGVDAPGWYAHLFAQWQSGRTDTSTTWLVRMAQALRRRDLPAPPASVVEATRLADTLAVLRGRPTAGLRELTDASVSTLLGGETAPLALIHGELMVGHDFGSVPADTPMVPLAADLIARQKSLRLKRTAAHQEVTLDLRTPAGLAKSQLFHQLLLLDLPWAERAGVGQTTGTFKEAWGLEWQPEFEVVLIEASGYGSTVQDAAAARIVEAATAATSLVELAALLEDCLLADLPSALNSLIRQVDTQAAQHTDVASMLVAVEPLARALRYGDVRGLRVNGLGDVVTALVRRACVGLRAACQNLDDDAAARMRTSIEAAQRGLSMLSAGGPGLSGPGLSGPALSGGGSADPLLADWDGALQLVGADGRIHGAVSGRVNRLLLDAGSIEIDEAGRRMSRRLSLAAVPAQAAAWLDGFLTGEVILLLEEVELLSLVDSWLAGVGEEVFDDLLPLLRRTFSAFEAPERRQIGQRVNTLGKAAPKAAIRRWDAELVREPVARVAGLLGLVEA